MRSKFHIIKMFKVYKLNGQQDLVTTLPQYADQSWQPVYIVMRKYEFVKFREIYTELDKQLKY